MRVKYLPVEKLNYDAGKFIAIIDIPAATLIGMTR